MNKLIQFYKKHKGIVLYLIFGALTTLVNILTYYLCYQVLSLSNVLSTIIAWVVAVAFAFVTNKLFVFESSARKKKAVIEAVNFTACRVGTGVIEIAMMYLLVDILAFNGTIMKLITNVVVIILNYVASKLLVFRGKKER